MIKYIYNLLLLFCLSLTCVCQNDTLEELFRSSFSVFELQRNPNGIYRDSKLFSGTDYHPASVSNTGIGLISLCIADTMGWVSNAADQALTTLKSITGHNPPFNPDRNASGYFRHWLDMNTGTQVWGSEYSTIDTDILMCGALFCKRYFSGDDSIAYYTDQLWNSINFSKSIADPQSGAIYLTMDSAGNGIASSITLQYNEYMIAAWLAMNADTSATSPARMLWDNHYAQPLTLPVKYYGGIPVLTDHPGYFLSSFTHQFNYYLCHYFDTSSIYMMFFDNARRADSLWWANCSIVQSYEWGLGAGSAPSGYGYHADKINDNPDTIVSPHIIAGFLPVYPDGKYDLLNLLHHQKGLYTLPNAGTESILWRYSLSNPAWKAPEVQGIDYSTMLFGLASLPEFLGTGFFQFYNDFFNIDTVNQGVFNLPEKIFEINIFPNPVKSCQYLYLNSNSRIIKVLLTDILGKIFFVAHYPCEYIVMPDIRSGIYLLKIFSDYSIQTRKVVVK